MRGLGLATDAARRRVTLTVAKAVYGEEALLLAARALAGRAEAEAEEDARGWTVTLTAARPASAAALEALAGDFLAELLGQECRALVAGLGRDVRELHLTQALLAARGGEAPPAAPAEDDAFRAEARALLDKARAEER